MKEGDSGGNYENIFADIMVEDLTPDIARQLNLPKAARGVVVAGVERGSAAEEAGLKRGDVIEEINKQRINNTKDYRRIASKIKKGESVTPDKQAGQYILYYHISGLIIFYERRRSLMGINIIRAIFVLFVFLSGLLRMQGLKAYQASALSALL